MGAIDDAAQKLRDAKAARTEASARHTKIEEAQRAAVNDGIMLDAAIAQAEADLLAAALIDPADAVAAPAVDPVPVRG